MKARRVFVKEWRHVPLFLGSDEEFADASRGILCFLIKEIGTVTLTSSTRLIEFGSYPGVFWRIIHALSARASGFEENARLPRQ